ncbi:MAG TPA: hypothetical protein DIT48_11705 [Actinobacteria bacterium]|nr:hypothetical protein [Actinomycetota bacterium]HCP61778.1 hypothetical protein [Actinomycetota bacterium]
MAGRPATRTVPDRTATPASDRVEASPRRTSSASRRRRTLRAQGRVHAPRIVHRSARLRGVPPAGWGRIRAARPNDAVPGKGSPSERGRRPVRGTRTGSGVATRAEVGDKLRELIGRLDDADEEVRDKLADSLPESRSIEIRLTDLETSFWTELAGGRMGKLRSGEKEDADIRIEVRSDDLVALVDGKRSLFSSYLSGQVRIRASVSDLMRLRKLA